MSDKPAVARMSRYERQNQQQHNASVRVAGAGSACPGALVNNTTFLLTLRIKQD